MKLGVVVSPVKQTSLGNKLVTKANRWTNVTVNAVTTTTAYYKNWQVDLSVHNKTIHLRSSKVK